MANNDELRERIALLEKEVELLEQILKLEEQIHYIKRTTVHKPTVYPTPWTNPIIYY